MGQGNFNLATRGYTQQMTAMTYSANGTSSQDLPQTGFLHAIDLIFSVTLTVATGGFTPNSYIPCPLGLVKRIRLTTNEGADIWNTSAWGAYLYNRTLRSGFDGIKAHSGQFDYSTDGGLTPLSPWKAYETIPTGGSAKTATATYLFPIRLQIAWGEMDLTGLVLLQNPGVRFTLNIDWGATADIATSVTNTTITATVTPALECFLVPKDEDDYPDLGFAKTVLEDIAPLTQSGVFSYQPPRGNTYTRIIQEFVNNPSSVNTPMDHSNVTNLGVVFSQTQNIVNDLSANRLYRQRRLYGQDLPSGVFVTELSLGMGVPEFPNGRDNLDTSQITDFQVNSTIGSGTTVSSGSFVRTVKEQLVVVQG
jgi:hypothetical protein